VYPTPGSITQETASGYVTFWSAEKAGYGFSGFIIMFILYPLFPIVYSSEKYFRKRGYENTVIEHERVKKIIYSLLPIFILTIIDTYFLLYSRSIEDILFPQIFQNDNIYIHTYYYLRFSATLVFASALLKTTFLISKKDFRFYLARACMKLASKKEDDVKKMRYLIKGLKSYNRYISKEFRFQINDFKIYSKIINSPAKKRSESMKLVTEAFEGDKLEAVNHLSGFTNRLLLWIHLGIDFNIWVQI
jgi:hypothetical protein